MVSLDKALTTFYRLSVVTMYSSAAVWPQFLMEDYKLYVAVSWKRWETRPELLL